MNPAMALCQSIVGLVPWSSLVPYVIAEMLGGIAGACMAWFIYADDFKASEFEVDPVAIRNIFSTNPTTESYNLPRNFAIEAFDTFVFLTGILCIAANVSENTMMLGIGVGLLVWAVGMGLGGVTGFAMNQARDLGPRITLSDSPHCQQNRQQLEVRPAGPRHRPLCGRDRSSPVHHAGPGRHLLGPFLEPFGTMQAKSARSDIQCAAGALF